MAEIKNRLSEALSLRAMRQVDLAERTGLTQSQINSWKRNRWQPKQEALYKMAKVLDVSELWLAGYDVPMERPVEQKKMDDLAEIIHKLRNNNKYVDIMNYIIKLDDTQLETVELMLEGLSKNR